tara:strand:- start:141 stop:407 length:267 start_codon:yes stop_codon:yes gene_type:complete
MNKYDEQVKSFYKKLNINQKADMLKLLKKDFIVSNENHNLDYPYPIDQKKTKVNLCMDKIYLECEFKSVEESITELSNAMNKLYNIKL